MIGFFKYLDFFSQPVQFNGYISQKQKTNLGIILSLSISVLTLYYLIYLSQLYFSNQIDPKFRSQNFVTNDDVNITLSMETFGFQLAPQFDQDFIQKQESQNKTYIVFLAFYIQRSNSTYLHQQLDVVKCQNPELDGFYCIDYTTAPKLNISTSHKRNIFSELTIYPYRCQDIDSFKQFVPNNCADPGEIEDYLSNLQNTLNFKIQVSQINTTSKQVEVNYVNNRLPALGNFLTLAELKVKKQITSVKDGVFFQSESIFSSPITAQFASTSIDYKSYVQQTGKKMISLIVVDVDESVEYFYIQYPPFTEVLALCNSFFAMLMILGIVCKIIANSNLVSFKNELQQNSMTKSVLVDENEAAENNQRIQIPIQTFKQLKSLSVLNQGNSIDQKQGSSPQQNLLSLDNQTSLTQSNATFQPQQDSNDIINKFNRDSPLLLFKGNMLKRDFTQSQNQMTNKRHQQNSFSQKSQIQTLNQEQAEDVNKNKSYSHQFLSLNLDQEVNQTFINDGIQKSYIEEQFAIQQSEELQSIQINQFLKRYQNQQNLSQVDKRIFSSMFFNQPLYFSNQIDPKFRSQSFIQNEDVDIPLHSDLFGFQLASQFNNDLIMQQNAQNKTFIVFLAFYFQRNSSYNGYQQLDVIKCKSPQLDGYYCIDYSNATNLIWLIIFRLLDLCQRNSQSVFRNGQSFDQKLNSSPQQNLLQQDNQTSISNVLLQPHQELSQVFTKHSRNSPPLKSFQSDKVKKEKSQQKELQSQQISLFLQRFQCQQNLTQIDKRIFSSMPLNQIV
ncbi:hypothetical protein ABPG74_002783 [Tetrahymena malaccensis]